MWLAQVPGEIKRSRDLRGGRWSWTLTFAQKRSWVGRWSWAEQVGHFLLWVVQVVRQQQCNGHCLSDCPAQQLKQQLHSAQVAGQWRGDAALTLPLFWQRSTVSGLFQAVSAVEPFTLLSPSHSVPVPELWHGDTWRTRGKKCAPVTGSAALFCWPPLWWWWW